MQGGAAPSLRCAAAAQALAQVLSPLQALATEGPRSARLPTGDLGGPRGASGGLGTCPRLRPALPSSEHPARRALQHPLALTRGSFNT